MAIFKCTGNCMKNGKPVCEKLYEEWVTETDREGNEVTRVIYHCELEEDDEGTK